MIRLVPLGLLFALSACSLFDGAPSPPPLAELRAAPEVVTLGSQDLVLSTTLWRNLQPGPTGPRPLLGVFYVETADSSAFPPGVTAEAAFVVNGRDVWSTDLPEEGTPGQQTLYRLVRVARGGPEWRTGVYVDAVVRLRDEQGRTYLLRAAEQYVEGAE